MEKIWVTPSVATADNTNPSDATAEHKSQKHTVTWALGTYRHGQGGTCPWKCCKVLFVLQMLSKVSVDEVMMHYY